MIDNTVAKLKAARCTCDVPEYDTMEIMGRTIYAFCEDEFCTAQFTELWTRT